MVHVASSNSVRKLLRHQQMQCFGFVRVVLVQIGQKSVSTTPRRRLLQGRGTRIQNVFNLSAPGLFFFNFSTPCIQNVNNTETKQVRIMKQTAV